MSFALRKLSVYMGLHAHPVKIPNLDMYEQSLNRETLKHEYRCKVKHSGAIIKFQVPSEYEYPMYSHIINATRTIYVKPPKVFTSIG